GVYVVLREWPTEVQITAPIPGFTFKDGSPMLPLVELADSWALPTPVLYIGKAGRRNAGAPLKKRLSQLVRYGRGTTPNHNGGQAIWQVPDAIETLIVCWRATPDAMPVCIEEQLLRDFEVDFGMLPMGNRTHEPLCKHQPPCGRLATHCRPRAPRALRGRRCGRTATQPAQLRLCPRTAPSSGGRRSG